LEGLKNLRELYCSYTQIKFMGKSINIRDIHIYHLKYNYKFNFLNYKLIVNIRNQKQRDLFYNFIEIWINNVIPAITTIQKKFKQHYYSTYNQSTIIYMKKNKIIN